MDAPPVINLPVKPPRDKSCLLALLICFGLPFVVFCYLGITRFPPKDEKLIASFYAHHAAYERLREMLQADGQLSCVGKSGITMTNSSEEISAQEANLPAERYYEYVALLKEVGGRFVVRREGDHADPEIPLWSWGFGSTGGNIGICWEHQAPTNQVPSLAPRYAGRTADGQHKIAYRHIEANWYLWTDL